MDCKMINIWLYGILMEFNGIYDGYPLVNVYMLLWEITMLLMGKSTNEMTMFNSFLFVYQRVNQTDSL